MPETVKALVIAMSSTRFDDHFDVPLVVAQPTKTF